MKIILDPKIAVQILSYAHATSLEFSGLGFARKEGEDLYVYDFILMNIGSPGFTQINPNLLLPLIDRPDAGNLKVWLHKHPMGSGKPGPENWSMTDETTCVKEPLGSLPELVKWSAAVVLTPRGWVGRIDNHVHHKTVHVEVEPDTHNYFRAIEALMPKEEEFPTSQTRGVPASIRTKFGDFSHLEIRDIYDLAYRLSDYFRDSVTLGEILDMVEEIGNGNIDQPFLVQDEVEGMTMVDWEKYLKSRGIF